MGGCKINSVNPPFITTLHKLQTAGTRARPKCLFLFSSGSSAPSTSTPVRIPESDSFGVQFKTLGACKLGIARYPDFAYDAAGGTGTGQAKKMTESQSGGGEISISFDLETLYIPPLSSETTRFLGLPLPPLLKIDIVPESFGGKVNQETGKVELEFLAKFCFSVGTIYRAPPLIVKTVLTSEESTGTIRRGRGDGLDEQGRCRLVGVATVDPIDDVFMNSFLGLPTECLADLNAVISFSN